MRRALLALAVLLVMPLAAAAPGDDVGWSVQLASTTYFVGDWVNVSVVGPRPPPVPFLYFNLTDPNGTLIDQRYIQVVNGSANYSFLLQLESSPGNYLLNVTANSTLVAQIGLKVVYDELNYLSKRVSLLERDNDRLEARLATQRQEIRDVQAKVAWYWLIPILVGVIFVLMGWWLFSVVLPTWRLVFEWYYPLGITLDKQMTRRVRIITMLLGRFHPADFRATYPRLRVNRLPIEFSPLYRAMRRAKGLPDLELPHDMQLPDDPRPTKVRKVRKERGAQ